MSHSASRSFAPQSITAQRSILPDRVRLIIRAWLRPLNSPPNFSIVKAADGSEIISGHDLLFRAFPGGFLRGFLSRFGGLLGWSLLGGLFGWFARGLLGSLLGLLGGFLGGLLGWFSGFLGGLLGRFSGFLGGLLGGLLGRFSGFLGGLPCLPCRFSGWRFDNRRRRRRLWRERRRRRSGRDD